MDLSGQEARRSRLVDKVGSLIMQHYGEDGSFHGPYTPPDERDRMRAAAILMENGREAWQARAETLIRGCFGGPDGDVTRRSLEENLAGANLAQGAPPDWNIFQSNIATGMLARHGSRFATDVRDKLRRIAARNTARVAGSGQADYMFHGANDNMPAHATCGLILAGQCVGNDQAVADGRYRLGLFAELLSRRGLCSEYASGTYTPLTMGAMAELVELATDAATRDLALQIEQQLWADAVGHFHPGSGKPAGGQTRAYTVNTVAHLDTMMALLWVVTGEPPFTDPVRDLVTMQPRQVTHFEGDAFKTACGVVFAILPTFHFPANLGRLMDNRPDPYRFFGSAEQMYAQHDDVGGREAHSTVYQTADYSLATSDHGFMTGNQSEKVRIAYRRIEKPASFQDTGVLFFRYLVDDQVPGEPTSPENCAPGEAGLLKDLGLARTLQLDDAALLVTRAENHNLDLPAKLHRLRLTVNLPIHYHDVEAAFIGDRELPDAIGEGDQPEPVFLDLGRLYVALFPLTITDHGRPALIRVETANHYRVISFINYEGSAREFDEQTLRETFNGCFVHVGGPDEYGSFAAFRESFRLPFVEDWWFAGNRRTRLLWRGHELLLNWSAYSDTVRSATIDGREPPRHRLWATGMDSGRFPLLSGYRPRVGHLPLDDLTVVWYDHMTWQIGEQRGDSPLAE